MPIELKYSASAGALALAGMAAGKNKYDARMMQTFMPLVRQQMQQRADQESQSQQQAYGLRRAQMAAHENRFQQDRQFEQQKQMAEFGYQQRENLQSQLFDQQSRRDDALLDRQKELEDLRAQHRQEQITAMGLASGKVRYTPEQRRQMEQIDNTIGELQSNPGKWGLRSQEEVDHYVGKLQNKRRQFQPLPVNADEQPVPLDKDFANKTYEWNGGLYTRDKNGVWQRIRGDEHKQAQQKPDKADLSNPLNYQSAYTKAWSHLVNARKLSAKNEFDSIQEPSATEIHDQLKQWGFNLPRSIEEPAIDTELKTLRSKAKSFQELSPADQSRYQSLMQRWSGLFQPQQATQQATPQAVSQSAPPPLPPSPDRLGENYMTPEEIAQYQAGQQAIRNPQMVAQIAGEAPTPSVPQASAYSQPSAYSRPMQSASAISPNLEIQLLQRELNQIDSGVDPMGNERRYHGSGREELAARIEALRREQAGVVDPRDYFRQD